MYVLENCGEIELVEYECGMCNIVYLDYIGLVILCFVFVYCVWFSEEEKEIICK